MKKILVVLMAMLTMAIMVAGCGGDSKKAAYPADGDISVIIPKAPPIRITQLSALRLPLRQL